METINSMASSAAKVIWGDNEATNTENQRPGTESTSTNTNTTTNPATMSSNETQGQEPVSGKLGDTSKGEPFDAGNIESGQTVESKNPVSESKDPIATGSKDPITESKGTSVESKGPTTEQPSTTGDTGFKAAQADVRDPEDNLTTDPKTEAARKNVDDTGDIDSSENPAKVDGPGPKPIEEVAKERGGDAGKSGELGGASSGGGLGADATKEGESVGADKADKGSGEQYVKSSGLAADGGDFDATKPGAGREADRLLEEKGIANPAAAAAAPGKQSTEEDSPTESPDGKEKKSLKDKIKSKLHKN